MYLAVLNLSRDIPTTMDFVTEKAYLNKEWLESKLPDGDKVVSVSTPNQEKLGGMSADIIFLNAELADGRSLPLIIKKSPDQLSQLRVTTGCAREALFYQECSKYLGDVVARTYHTHANMKTGEMAILMDCCTNSVPLGVFFGPSNPNNWSIKDTIESMCEGNPGPKAASSAAFSLYAKLHGTYWRDESLKSKTFLRCSDWIQGQGRETWQGSQDMARKWCENALTAMDAGTSHIHWDPHLVECLKVSFSKVDWDNFQSELGARPFSLVQGDAHPHNVLWVEQRTESACCKLIDFEQVGLGSPAQDIGQFLVSHMPPATRREVETELLTEYHEELLDVLKASGKEAKYSFADCWAEYVAGGFGRWAWFMAYFSMPTFSDKGPLSQFFHDQVAAFAKDHIKIAGNAPMPRV